MELKFGVISIKFGVWNAYEGIRMAKFWGLHKNAIVKAYNRQLILKKQIRF